MPALAPYYAIPLLLGATVAITLVFLAWQRIREPGAQAFMVAMSSVALWSFAYAFEVMSVTLAGKLPWHSLIYMASSILPAFWVLFLLQQEERPKRRIRLWGSLLMIEPVVYSFLTWTNDLILPGMAAPHHLLWRDIRVNTAAALPYLVIERGIGFYLHTAYTYLLVLISMMIIMRLLKRESSTLSYWQVLFLAGGIFAPIVANWIHLVQRNPLPINLTPFALITMGIAIGWFAFRFELWDIIPAAHNAIFEHMYDGVIIINSKKLVIDINPAALQLLGMSQEQVRNQPLEEIFPQWAALTGLQTLLQEHDPIAPTAFELQWPDTKLRHIDLIVSDLRDRRNRVNGRLLTLRDVTKRREMEQALEEERALLARRVAERTADLSEANAQLERAARLKDEFMASMSHELRTPLNTILGLSEALQDQVYGNLTVRQKRALTNIEESGRHLLALINDVLDVSKIEAGKLILDPGPVAVDSLCQAALNFVKQAAASKQQELVLELDPTVKVIHGDERRLKQILVNLLNNAVKFTPNGGCVGLRVVGAPGEEVVQFTVWDTGVGIAAADMSRLFEPFVQLDSRLARQYEGTGLGLALVYRMTKLHGGSVAVESEVGNGSHFTVSLPWSSQEQLPLSAALLQMTEHMHALPNPVVHEVEGGDGAWRGAPTAGPRPKIFIIEDNETNIHTFTDYLLASGYDVHVARSGAEALLSLRKNKPDLILMDIQMPGMDGLEVMQQVRQEETLRHVPIVALTALAMPGDRDRCLAAGADEYISKPVSLRRLVYLIENRCRPALALEQGGR
ncbi:MAG: histidine kinase N-terminal 7TM domain-containing protein [Caldilineaceae bacterium]